MPRRGIGTSFDLLRVDVNQSPPILRVHRVYKPPPNMSLEPGETEERAPSPVDRNLKRAATIDAEQEAPAAAEEGISSEPSEVKPEVLLRGSSSRTSCLPVYVELKDEIAARENSIKDIHANISSDTEALEVLRSSTKSAAESIALSVGTYKTDKEVLGKLETERTELARRKQSLETRLEDGGFDEENPEDMNLLQSLEAEEEDLNLSLSEVLTKIEECSARLLQSQTEMKLSRSKLEELKMELERAELKFDNAQVVLRREEALLAFQKEELSADQGFRMGSQSRRQRTVDRNRTDQLGQSSRSIAQANEDRLRLRRQRYAEKQAERIATSNSEHVASGSQRGIRRKVIEMVDKLKSLSGESVEYESKILTRFLNHSSIRKTLKIGSIMSLKEQHIAKLLLANLSNDLQTVKGTHTRMT
ncbi:hypothetical protein R1sor_015152 [Riccia sorocarpa]|uniref:Uncharacterized protein n=1 Tax=Riccia sorocarpa TaxID=122646 RepID=A0ABD3HBS4_9MARC